MRIFSVALVQAWEELEDLPKVDLQWSKPTSGKTCTKVHLLLQDKLSIPRGLSHPDLGFGLVIIAQLIFPTF